MGLRPYGGDPTTVVGGQQFKELRDEGKERFSETLISLKNVGSLGSSIPLMLSQTPNEEERKIVRNAIKNLGSRTSSEDISKLFAKEALWYGGKKCLRFLEYWGETVLTPEHYKALLNIGLFANDDFEKLDTGEARVLARQKHLLIKNNPRAARISPLNKNL